MVPGCELNEWSMMDSSGGPPNRTHSSYWGALRTGNARVAYLIR